MKNWLTCDANKGRRRYDKGWSEEKSKEWKRDWGTKKEGITSKLWGTRERNFEDLENVEGMLCHFKIFLGHNCPSII